MRIACLHALGAITLATGLLFGGSAFAGGAYGSAPPRVDAGPLSAGTIKPAHYKKRKVRRHNRNRHYRHNSRNRHVRSHRRQRRGYDYGYRPHFSYRRSYYGYYRPYGVNRRYFGYGHNW